MATQPFFWGSGGRRLTPEEIAREREVAAVLSRRGDPAFDNAGWLGVLGRGLEGVKIGLDNRNLDAAAGQNAAENQSLLSALLGGGSASSTSPVASALTSGVNQELTSTSPAPVVAEGEIADYIRQAATARGIDPEIAVRVAMSEGGVKDPIRQSGVIKNGVREQSYGPFQLYFGGGLGNKALEAGIDARDPNQWRQGVDFALDQAATGGWGPWYGAAKVGIGNRTGLDNARAIGFNRQASSPAAAAIEQAAPSSGYVDPTVSAPNYNPAVASALVDAPMAAPVNVAPAPRVASVPSAPVQNVAPTNSLGVSPAVLQALTSPYASESTKTVANLLLQQQQGAAAEARKQALAEQQRQQEIARRQQIAGQTGINPAYAADDELWKGATGNLFAAPSTSTVGSTVVDNRTGQPIYQGTPENPTSVQEYEYAKNQGYEGSYAQFQSDMKRASANNTTINTGEGNKFYNTLDEKNAATFSGLSDTGMQARSTLAQVDQLGQLLERVPTGATAVLKQAAGEYGINTEGLDDIQAATALINRLVPAQRQPGSGSMSDQDLALFKQSLPRLINQPGGNARIVNTLKSISQYQIDQGAIADRVANRELTPAEGRQAIAALPNPLAGFKPPAAGEESKGWSNVESTIPGVTIRRKN
jgi:hypothetical protein